MLVTLQTIGSSCGVPTSGYVGRLFILPADQVTYIAEPSGTASVCMQVATMEGAELLELPLRPKNCTYSESTSNGDSYAVSLQLSYPSNSNKALTQWAAQNKRRRWVAIFSTVNGQKYIAGEVGNGLRMTISEATYISIGFSGQFSHTMWQLPTVEPAVLFSGPTFQITDFSTDFQLES